MKKILLPVLFVAVWFNSSFAQWTKMTFSGGNVNCVKSKGNLLYAGCDSGLYRSSDLGNSWTKVNLGFQGGKYVNAILVHNSIFLCGTMFGKLYRSTDGGTSWAESSISSGKIEDMHAHGAVFFAVFDQNGIYKSADYGLNWVQCAGTNGGYQAKLISDGPLLYAGINDRGVLLSTDSGITWMEKNNGLLYFGSPNKDITSIAKNSDGVFAGTQVSIYFTDNQGDLWSEKVNGLPNPLMSFCMASDGANVFAGAGKKVFLLKDGSSMWENVSTGLPDSAGTVFNMDIAADQLFIGTINGGFWKRPLSEMITLGFGNVAREELVVYPNPVSDKLILQKTLDETLTIKVRDVLGKEVYAGSAEKGTLSYEISFADLLPGVYFITVGSAKGMLSSRIVRQ